MSQRPVMAKRVAGRGWIVAARHFPQGQNFPKLISPREMELAKIKPAPGPANRRGCWWWYGLFSAIATVGCELARALAGKTPASGRPALILETAPVPDCSNRGPRKPETGVAAPSSFSASFAALDKDNNGSISQEEFVAGMKGKLRKGGARKAKTRFAKLDQDHDGNLTREELGSASRVKKKGKKRKNAN